jgi:hypothetical protein
LDRMGRTNGESMIDILEAVLDARSKMDPNAVSEVIWNAFLVFSWILVPSIQGW